MSLGFIASWNRGRDLVVFSYFGIFVMGIFFFCGLRDFSVERFRRFGDFWFLYRDSFSG